MRLIFSSTVYSGDWGTRLQVDCVAAELLGCGPGRGNLLCEPGFDEQPRAFAPPLGHLELRSAMTASNRKEDFDSGHQFEG